LTVTLPLATADTAPARDVTSLDQRRRV